ncbi:MAG: hypothetical protein AAFS12_05170 [Cyanobacteria bacterium J06632_19]
MRTIFYALFILVIFQSCNKTNSEVFVLPKGYSGAVIVVYEQEEGINTNVVDGVVVYHIPKNGILKVKTALSYGSSNPPEFYEESQQEKNKIEFIQVPREKGNQGMVACCYSNGKSLNNDNHTLVYTKFIVGNSSELEVLAKQLSEINVADIVQGN